ncbi:MAG: hypothetical protein E7463_03425 [Ruminococcaceae bacterium]|nr:hypothetical protein [Oscillospiraceae bacterium]
MRQSQRVSTGAIVAALAVVLLYISCMTPTMQLTVVAMAGVLTAAVMIEAGTGLSMMVFAAVSMLSLLILPDKSSGVFYLLFFGHYPVVKYHLERIRRPFLCWMAKMAAGNLCLLGIWLILRLFFPEWVFEYALWIVWAVCNLTFVLFDIALTRLLIYYQYRIRPRIFGKR